MFSVVLLMFENIGLPYISEKKRVGVVLDGSFLIGLISIALLGFFLSVEITSGQVATRGGIPIRKLLFDRTLLTVAGGFIKTIMDNATYYTGGIIIGFKLWMIQAIAGYVKVLRLKAIEHFLLTGGEDIDEDCV
jgi:hypothetical protein